MPKALGLYVPEYNTKFHGALMDAKNAFNNSGDVEIKKEIKPILGEIDSLNSVVYQMFSAAYLEYSSNPCEKDDLLKERIGKINGVLQDAIALSVKAMRLKEREFE